MRNATSPSPQRRQSDLADEVVLLSDDGEPVGTANRLTVHGHDTPLHLAFSTYLFNDRGEVLLTRRALHKKTWPGVWTNSCCGHPRPGEAIEDAARRRILEELGLTVGALTPLLPHFRYRATDAGGIVENELCPVFGALAPEERVHADPAEVAEFAWVAWEDVCTAVATTPQVYSPWSAQQIPQIASGHANPARFMRACPVDLAAALRDVETTLAQEIMSLRDAWRGHTAATDLDILPHDLPAWLGDLLGGGKRLRVAMAYWGYIAAGGAHGSTQYSQLIRAASALEVLHLFALVHDDVMDESDSRRGRPSAHAQAAAWHRDAHAHGSAELFGRNLALLLGDLAHIVAHHLADGLAAPLRSVWHELSVELIAGQRADLTGAAAGRRDRPHAEHVARAKSGRYTVTHPLRLGALAAGATPEALNALAAFGDHIGRAFALRDDYLGVWGDPALTGKPAGDDIREAKPTVLLSVAMDRLHGPPAALLNRLGTTEFRAEDVAVLVDAMREAHVDEEIEKLIADAVRDAFISLGSADLAPEGVAGLRETANKAAWRTT